MKFLDRKRLPALYGVNFWISLLLYKMLDFLQARWEFVVCGLSSWHFYSVLCVREKAPLNMLILYAVISRCCEVVDKEQDGMALFGP